MALKKKPVTGMKDILPKEMEIRNYVMNMIVKHMENLDFLQLRHHVWSISKISAANRVERMRN